MGLKNRQFPTQTSPVLEQFLVILASFLCFFSKLFFNMVSGPFFHDFGIIFDLILHHFKIIFVSVFVSLENVISETPCREINGFAFWNVLRNMKKLGRKPDLKRASQKNRKMMRKSSGKEGRNDAKIAPGPIF